MQIRCSDGPCAGEHDVRLAPGAAPPEEFLVLLEAGRRQRVSEISGGSIPGVNTFAVHRFARRDGNGTPVYRFVGRRQSRGY